MEDDRNFRVNDKKSKQKDRKKRALGSRLGRTLFLWFLLLSITPLTIVSIISYKNAYDSLSSLTIHQLEITSNFKMEHINNYFRDRLIGLNLQSKIRVNEKFLLELKTAFTESHKSLEKFVKSNQWAKLTRNTGRAGDLAEFCEEYEYYDVLLIDNEFNILFSVARGNDLGQNLKTGPLKNTQFARKVQEAFEVGRPLYSDLEYYEPVSAVAGFLIQVIINETGEKIGLVAFQIRSKNLDTIMQERIGLGQTGESYLVGDDFLLRTNPIQGSEDLLLNDNTKIDTDIVKTWAKNYVFKRGEKTEKLEEKSDINQKSKKSHIYTGRNGVPVLGFVHNLEITGIPMAVVAEVETSEVYQPVKILLKIAVGMFVITLVIVLIVAFSITRKIIGPIRKLSAWAVSVSTGDLDEQNIKVPKNEIGEMNASFHELVFSLRALTSVCDAIAKGDYSATVEIRSDKDILGKAMEQMRNNLKQFVVNLNDSESRLNSILNTAVAAIITITEEGIVENYNIAAQEMFGYSPEEIIGKNVNKIMPAPYKQEHDGYLKNYIETGVAKIIGCGREVIGLRKNGEKFPLNLQVSEVIIREKRVFSAVIQDLSDMKKAEQSEREAKEALERELWIANSRTELSGNMSGEEETAPLAHNIITCLSNLLGASIGTVYVADENQQLKLVASYAFLDREGNFNEFKPGEGLVGQAALEKKTIVFSAIPKDSARINYGMGEVLPTHYLITPILYEGMAKGVIALGSAREFTLEQREFVEKVSSDIGITLSGAQSREKIEILLEETREQSEILKTQQQKLQQSNSEFEAQTKVLQTSEGQLKIQQEELQATNEELEEQTKALQESEEKLKVQQEELQVTNEELEEKTRSLEKQRDEIVSKNFEVEKARKEIEIKAKDLEEVSRYKSEFLANMSHELRTPLNSLLILASTLADNEEKNLSADQIESVEIIHSSGNDLLSLINEILDLSKVESGKMSAHPEDVPLKEIINRMEQNFKSVSREKRIKFHIVQADHLPEYIHTDRQKLEQILKNLLSNAFKFTSSTKQAGKGNVTLTIRRPGTDIELKTKGLTPQNAIAFAISDDGIGIPEEKRRIIFEAFQQVDGTTSRKYGGTGLGLSLSREFAKLLGGKIILQSAENKGSTFTLCLPEMFSEKKSSQKEQSQEVTSLPSPDQNESMQPIERKTPGIEKIESSSFQDDREDISAGDKTILIIEDDTKFSKVLFDIAHKKGFKGLVAFDGETGLKLASEYQPKAIVLDIMLPGIDGWVVMDRLKDNPQTRHIPVHFMSALEEEQHVLKKGAIGYLSKPVSKEQLDSAFKKMESFMTSNIKNLLVVSADEEHRKKIIDLIKSKKIKIVPVKTGQAAYELVKSRNFDCMIVDGELSDIPVFELLKKIQEGEPSFQVPVIVYTDRKFSREEDRQLKQYANSIIVRSAKSKERLLDETALFLHCVESNFSEVQQKMIRQVHDRELILKDKTVLVVDDDMRNTFALSKALKARGMNVLLAEDGKIALKILGDEQGIDIVLMDIMMPVMDGYEATREIRKDKKFEKLPILALTAKAMGGDREKCIEAGANDYLSKPVDLEKLVSMLRVWLYQ